MKKIRLLLTMSIYIFSQFAYGAGLVQTKNGLKSLQNEIHVLVGVVFLITGVIVGALIWRGTKTWEDCSKWVIGVAFAGGVAEFISMFYPG